MALLRIVSLVNLLGFPASISASDTLPSVRQKSLIYETLLTTMGSYRTPMDARGIAAPALTLDGPTKIGRGADA